MAHRYFCDPIYHSLFANVNATHMKLKKIVPSIYCLFMVIRVGADSPSLNLQLHYDIRRDHPTVTHEFLAFDRLGYTFCFMDLNFDRYRKSGGVSDVYFEFMRYFRLTQWNQFHLNFTVQYDDGSEPIKQVWLAGINVGNIVVGKFQLSSEFLLKKEYRLDVNWQYTAVWYGELWNHKLVLNGFMDFWINDIKNSHWPVDDPEIAKTRYSFQAEPQVAYKINSHWRFGSELEVSRGFLGSVTGRLASRENYTYHKWYFLSTIFIQYDF